MFTLILDGTILSALFFLAIGLEGFSQSAAFKQEHSGFTNTASRYVITAIVAFPWVLLARLRAGERAIGRIGTKLLLSAGVFSGKTYLSEILLSACLSLLFLSWFAARKWSHRLVRRRVNLTTSNFESKS